MVLSALAGFVFPHMRHMCSSPHVQHVRASAASNDLFAGIRNLCTQSFSEVKVPFFTYVQHVNYMRVVFCDWLFISFDFFLTILC